MVLIERREDIPEGKPTDLGWMLSCSGVHPEAVKIVEGLQGEVERLNDQLRGAVGALKIAAGCEHPETCGGPTGQAICLTCIRFRNSKLRGQ